MSTNLKFRWLKLTKLISLNFEKDSETDIVVFISGGSDDDPIQRKTAAAADASTSS